LADVEEGANNKLRKIESVNTMQTIKRYALCAAITMCVSMVAIMGANNGKAPKNETVYDTSDCSKQSDIGGECTKTKYTKCKCVNCSYPYTDCYCEDTTGTVTGTIYSGTCNYESIWGYYWCATVSTPTGTTQVEDVAQCDTNK
jgi:hypothetical protein